MMDSVIALSLIVLLCAFVFSLGKNLKRAKNMTKSQTYSKSVNSSLIEAGLFTEHGIVYNPSTNAINAQHKRSDFYHQSVL